MPNKTIAITGAGGALGRVTACLAAERGATLALIDYAELTDENVEAVGDGHLRLGGVDLTDFVAAEQAMNEIKTRTGRLDVLINIAGGFAWQTVTDGEVGTWDRMYALNVKTALNASKAALPHLIASGEGRIVNVGALGAIKAGAGMGAYAASKAGVARLTESLAEELKDKGVTVNAVLPSVIDTPANRASMPDAEFDRWVRPEDLAAAILFLASPEARAITGALIPVPGRV
ncbi:MAG: SDR family oxidoreductase [Maricaulaceae bacterium]|jgi:NAD(P)-dependent dehydrogenase (short-subunit alcohol dehydrogenase family)